MQHKSPGRTFGDYLTVMEAAQFLGVSPWTLRNWDRAGKLKPERHPVNGYRIYHQQTLAALLERDSLRGKHRATLASNLDWNEIGPAEHFVQFYETDGYLVESVSAYVSRALDAGEAALIVATPAHRQRIHKKLKARGIDVAGARARGQYQSLDAADMLAKFMTEGVPDPERFVTEVGAVIERLERAWPRVRAFGEMVALLWSGGNRVAALRLEELWNELARTHRFALYCAYPLQAFGVDADAAIFDDVCAHHARTLPAESYAGLATGSEQLQAISALQQKAQALEAEVARRKEAEQELADFVNQADRDRALLAAIVDSSDDAIVSKTLDGIIRSWNAGAERLFGYSPSEAIGRPITLIVPPERLEEEQSVLERLRRGERIDHFETVRLAKSGKQIPISLTISPVRDRAGTIIGASKVARDISDRKRAEKELRDADRRKDEFLATLAHELRNPLAPIRNSLHILRMSNGSGPALAHVLEVMDRQLHQLVRLIDDLLELSRISRGKIELKRERLDLRAVVNQAIETSKPSIDAAGHRLDLALPAEPLVVDGDMGRLVQVFANLLNNAAKYTDRGGNITVHARRVDGHAEVSIRDTGIGIPADMLEGVFDMFAQVDHSQRRSQGGLGIGLSLVRTLVGMHGGSVTAHSAGAGQGSEFTVRLPVANLQGASAKDNHEHNGQALLVRPTLRILAVDDNRDAADSLGMLLKFLGADVHVVYDGAAALAALPVYRPSVLLLDLGMPDMDGYAVARHVRQDPQSRDVLLIALTGWGQEDDRRRSLEAGFDHHLVKPVDLPALQALLVSLEHRS